MANKKYFQLINERKNQFNKKIQNAKQKQAKEINRHSQKMKYKQPIYT